MPCEENNVLEVLPKIYYLRDMQCLHIRVEYARHSRGLLE